MLLELPLSVIRAKICDLDSDKWVSEWALTFFVLNIRRIHTQERSRFPSRLKYWDIFELVQTSGNISLIAKRDDSGHRTAHAWYQALPLFWYARLEWWDRKYQDYLLERSHIRRDANNRAYSQIIARCIAICSAMLIAIISEIFMSTLVKHLKILIAMQKTRFVSR